MAAYDMHNRLMTEKLMTRSIQLATQWFEGLPNQQKKWVSVSL